MADLSRLFVVIGAKTGGFTKAMDGVQGKLQKASKQMQKVGAAMVGISVGIGAASLKMAADFDSAMREVNTMMLQTEDEFKAFSADVQALSKDMGVDAVKSANALYQAISAGVPKENAIDFLRIATKAAIGGVTETEVAVDGLTSVMNAFKIPIEEAERVADLMFTTVKGGKTTFEELSSSIFQVAPLAAAAGVKFEIVSAALATMTKQGVPTRVATTQLRQAIQAIIKPTDEMKEAIVSVGYESGDALLAELGLAGALDTLTEASGGSNEVLGRMFGSVEGLQAVLSLTGENAVVFAADIAAMGESAGAATDAFEQMEQSTGRQMDKLKAQFKDVGITIGMALMPALHKLLEIVMPIIEKIANWISEHPKLTAAILAGAAAFGTLLMVVGPLLSMLPGIIAALPVLGVAFAALTGPVGLIVAAVIGLIILIVKFRKQIVAGFKGLANIMLEPFRVYVRVLESIINWLIRQINKIHIEIPDWVPLIGGKTIGFNIPEISLPKFGAGGIVRSPTLAMVGERGPEAIMPLGLAGAGVGGTTINVTVQGSVIGEQDLAATIREQFLKIKGRNYSLGL